MHGELPKPTKTTAGRARRALASVLVLAAVAGGLYYVFGVPATEQPQRRGRYAASGPVPVLVANVARADVPVFLDAVGTTRPLNTVTIRPQVDGKLMAIAFKEGEDVQQGEVLARIDPTIYQAQLDQALAKKAQDEAVLANARNDLARYEKLAASKAINRQQVDTQNALVAQYAAQVKADQAAIENAQATLSYTTITAPISGRTGIRMVDEGNYVRASDASSAIVVITQLKPITVVFNLPQQDLARVNDAFAKDPLEAEALGSEDNKVIERGLLTVVDNQVDPATGTVKLKAEFANAGMRLWPGQFVNVRLKVDTLKDVVTIPTGAVQRGPNGTFVYVAKADNTVAMRPIKVRKQDEQLTVVASGLKPPERVVTTGFARLTDGARIRIGGGRPGPTPATKSRDGKPSAAGQTGERQQRAGTKPAARP